MAWNVADRRVRNCYQHLAWHLLDADEATQEIRSVDYRAMELLAYIAYAHPDYIKANATLFH